MENNLKVAICQPDIAWEQPMMNRYKYEKWLDNEVGLDVNLIVFPELFITGFSMNTKELGESMTGESVQWMLKMAAKHNATIAGSHIVMESARAYNRFIFAKPDGQIDYYDKRHLFRMGEEHEHYARGENRKVITIHQWRILPIICYDLRFPVWIRNRNDYDVMICVANWPAVRQPVWNNLLISRAIENLSYVIGVNRVGSDGRNIDYEGGSVVINMKGEYIHKADNTEQVARVSLEQDPLTNFRKKFPAHLDADDFIIS